MIKTESQQDKNWKNKGWKCWRQKKEMRRNHEQCDRKALGASRQTQLAIVHTSKKVQTLPIYDLRTNVSVIYIYIHIYIALSKIPRVSWEFQKKNNSSKIIARCHKN